MEMISYGAPPARRSAEPALGAARVDWVDVAKGICIILVVMMHATLGVEAEMGREGFMHWAVAFSKPFRMPDFFLVSGLFLSRVIDRDWRTYADKRVLHFAYFYVLWLLIQSAFKFGQVSGGTAEGFVTHILVSLVEPYSTLWFVYLLAVLSVVTKLLRPASPVVVLAFGAALHILPLRTESFLLNEFCDKWVYFLAGYLLAGRIFRLAEWARAHIGLALAGLAAWAVINGFLAFTPVPLPGRMTLADLPLVGLLAGMAGAMAIMALSAMLTRTPLAAPLRHAGANSIAIYLTFFLPMAAARVALIKAGIIEDAGLVSAIVTAAAVVVPLMIERIVRHTSLSFLYRRPSWARLGRSRSAVRLEPAN